MASALQKLLGPVKQALVHAASVLSTRDAKSNQVLSVDMRLLVTHLLDGLERAGIDRVVVTLGENSKAITDEAATKLQAKARGQQARKSVAEKKAISGAKDVKLPRSEAQREADRAEEARLKGTAMDKAKGGTPVKK